VLHIIKGWDKESSEKAQKYFKADPDSLTKTGQVEQKLWQVTWRDSYYNLRKALKSFADKGGKKGKAAKASELVLALREAKSSLARLAKQAKGYDGMVDDIKAMKALNIMTKVIDPNPPKAK
jgi:hypothetical protein